MKGSTASLRQTFSWLRRSLVKTPHWRAQRTTSLHQWTVELEKTNTRLAQEIAERKRVEQELRQAEAKYRSIFENAVEGIFQTTADGRYLEELLTQWGMHPTVADSGQAALAALQKATEDGWAFPLVLLDAQMPFMDGFTVAGRIKQSPALAGATPGLFTWIPQALLDHGDEYFHLADLPSYLTLQEQAGAEFTNPRDWVQKAILNVARIGKFSSDRTIREYATDIWGIASIP